MASSVQLRVCGGSNCCGARTLLRDIEELCPGHIDVVSTACMDKCEFGPNVQIATGSKVRTISGIGSFEKVVELVEEHIKGLKVGKMEKQIGKIKYAVRREEVADHRLARLDECISLLGGAAAAEAQTPVLFANLLVMRSVELKKTGQDDAAVTDALRAVSLTPRRAHAHEVLGVLLEAAGRLEEAVQAISTAIDLGIGVEIKTLERILYRIERKIRQKQQDAPSLELVGNAQGTHVEATPVQSVADTMASENLPDFMQWSVDTTQTVNHNCIRIGLRSEQLQICRALGDSVDDVWHIDIEMPREGMPGGRLVRSYTPISSILDYQAGYIELLVKVYPRGLMTQYLASLRPGEMISVSSPRGTLDVSAITDVLVVAGGSAVTVALQICAAVIRRHMKHSVVSLVLCNHTANDVLLHDRFDMIQKVCPTFKVVHLLSRGPLSSTSGNLAKWQIGRLDYEFLKGLVDSSKREKAVPLNVVVSGPPGLCQASRDAFLNLKIRASDIQVLDEARLESSESSNGDGSAHNALGVEDPSPQQLACNAVTPRNTLLGRLFSCAGCQRRKAHGDSETAPISPDGPV